MTPHAAALFWRLFRALRIYCLAGKDSTGHPAEKAKMRFRPETRECL
jgi:hypothetical protein